MAVRWRALIVVLMLLYAEFVFAADITATLDSSDGTSGFSFRDSSSAEQARIDSNGILTANAIGLGTSELTFKLEVKNDDYNAIRAIGNSGNSVGIFISNTISGGGAWGIVVPGTDGGVGKKGGLTIWDQDSGMARIIIDPSGKVGIGTTNPGASLEVNGSIKANNIWMKVAEVDLSASAGYTFSGLDGNTQKMYKIFFQGSLAAGGSDRYILIRPNGSAAGYKSIAYYDGDAQGSDVRNDGFYPGRSGWNLDADFTLEYTISAVTGRRRIGFGEACFWHTNAWYLGYGRAFGYWTDTANNITSIWMGPSGGTITGKVMLFALQ
ncbi:MAG: hypothetical protein PHQ23_16375 [Candidatus Wallbacteria bacterium]|nr:hypothetical protein [Candidatus Wallbacteria bacterium]